jgi:hypothetical protein
VWVPSNLEGAAPLYHGMLGCSQVKRRCRGGRRALRDRTRRRAAGRVVRDRFSPRRIGVRFVTALAVALLAASCGTASPRAE